MGTGGESALVCALPQTVHGGARRTDNRRQLDPEMKKQTKKSKAGRTQFRRNSCFPRRHLRNSAYFFAAAAGLWLPKIHAAILVDLDATALPTGPLASWSNTGTLGGAFTSAGSVVPEIVETNGVKGINLNTAGAGANGTHYVGPVAPSQIAAGGSRSVEAWILNPTIGGEETIVAWGRRGGPDGSNASYIHGSNPIFGAVGQWGEGPDVSWNGFYATNRWTYVAYTYDPADNTTRVYKDGVLAQSETHTAGIINTWEFDNTAEGLPLPFRVGRQNNANGTADGAAAPTLFIGRVRVHDTVLDAAAIAARMQAEKAAFWVDSDSDGAPDWFETLHGFSPTDNSDGSQDTDSDGLTNAEESQTSAQFLGGTANGLAYGTNPRVADTDGDGVNDGAEVKRTAGGQPAPTNPLLPDSDRDGLSDKVETGTGTFVDANNTGSNPLSTDSDSDGVSDVQEVAAGTNPNASASVPTGDLPPVVNLISTNLAVGPLNAWTNTGSLGGTFVPPTNGVPNVQSYFGVNAVILDGTNTFFTGPEAPLFLTGGGNRSVEGWILNQNAAGEESVLTWGRRGGPAGSNASFNHGTSAAFGAVGMWGGPDIGWGDAANVKQGPWTHIAYTYDAASMTTRVYVDGVETANETLTAPLITHDVDTQGRPLPFRLGTQNEANGNPSGGALRGSLAVAELRVYDRVLDPAKIQQTFTAGQEIYGFGDTDGDGLPNYYERNYAFLNQQLATDAPLDQDSDGLSNLGEFTARTGPDIADTDGDGVNDGAEVNRTGGATNPLSRDTDGDGLSDKAETGTGTFVNAENTGTNPLATDTDGDLFADGLEVTNGSNPNSATSLPPPKLLINLSNTNLNLGALSVWTNTGSITGNFTPPNAAGAGEVQEIAGIRGVTFDGVNDYYTGPVPNAFVTGNGSRTIEAWIYNPAAADEETIFSWGRRGGPPGSNCSFNHGLNATWGAIGHWDAPDIGWGDPANVIQAAWTYVAYTYEGNSLTTRVYSNGVEVNTEVIAAALNTHTVDTANAQLRFRVATQTDAGGGATPNLRGSMSIARIRVWDQALPAEQIAATYDQEKAAFVASVQLELSTAFNPGTRALNLTWPVIEGQTITVESTQNFSSWTTEAADITTGQFTQTVPATGNKFYRLRVQ